MKRLFSADGVHAGEIDVDIGVLCTNDDGVMLLLKATSIAGFDIGSQAIPGLPLSTVMASSGELLNI